MSDIITRDENGDLAVRTVSATVSETESEYDDLYVRTSDGKRALRVVGDGGDVSSVNGQKGNVVLTGADINATLTGDGDPVTATVTDHLQTLKNDEAALGTQVSGIEEKIPAKASSTNQLATMEDISSGSWLPDQAGHTGFLQTDGTNATWSDKEPLVNRSSVKEAIAIGNEKTIASSVAGIAIGVSAQTAATNGIAIGRGAQNYFGGAAIAIGVRARTTASGSIQLSSAGGVIGNQINDEEDTVKFANNNGNFKIMNADGTIPSERLAAGGMPTEEGTYTLKATVAADGTVTTAWVKDA